MIMQRTLKHAISAAGVGLHCGEKVTVTFKPADENHGIVFHRVDLPHSPAIPASADQVTSTLLSTTIGFAPAQVSTIEHLMAALAGMGIDNVDIDIDAEEVPVMDGSSAPFVFLLESAGICEQSLPKRWCRIKKPIEITQGEKWVRLAPYHGIKIEFAIDFPHPTISKGPRASCIELSPRVFIKEISRARTFGFLRDVEKLRAQNLALGGSLDNTIVLDDRGILNAGGLRYRDEFVKHKLLDAIGDLYLLGGSFIGCFQGFCSGHSLNHRLITTVLNDPEAWEWIDSDEVQRNISKSIQYDFNQAWSYC